MKLPMWMNKRKLAVRLVEYPLLRMLLFNFWFRLAFILLIFTGIAFILFFPKIWRVSPPDFVPVVRVSWLDLLQARSLRQSAQRAEQAGNLPDAYHAWLSAMANNPADTRSIRGLLRSSLAMKEKANPSQVRQMVSQCFWLLQLTRYDASDLDLVGDVFEKLKLYELNTTLLRQHGDLQQLALMVHYLKSLFHTGRMELFAELWPKVAANPALPPEMLVYQSAWEAGWGPRENRIKGWELLQKAQSNPAMRPLSLQLQLSVSLQQLHEDHYSQALQSLRELGIDSINHHVDYWKLLHLAGKKEEAIRLATTYPNPPGSPSELVSLVDGYALLGLKDQARQLLATYAVEFAYAEQVWWAYGNFLLAEKQFDALAPLALQIRQEAQARDNLRAYSFYLEGVSLHEQGRTAEASGAFQKCVETGASSEALAMTMSAEMVRRKNPQYAAQLLQSIEKTCLSNSFYWNIVSSAAMALKDVGLLNRAVTHAYQLNPYDWHIRNNYAATLLATRSKPEVAVRMTFELMVENPASQTARINHALALLLNRRETEAYSYLQSMDAKNLNSSEASSYHFALFQYYLATSDGEAAKKMLPKIDHRFLMPDEERWLDEAAAQIASKSSGA